MQTGLPEVGELLDAWSVHLEGDGIALNTRKNYRAAMRRYLEFLDGQGVTWDAVTPRVLDAWKVHLVRGLRMAARSSNNHISGVRNFYKWAKWNQYIDAALPCDLKIIKPPRLLPKPLSEADVLKLIGACQTLQDRASLEVMYSTGCRIAELLGMNLGDVDLDRGVILTMGKGAQERYLELGSTAKATLTAHLAEVKEKHGTDPGSPVWPGKWQGRMDANAFRDRLKRIAKAAGVPGRVTPHRLRHSFGTHLLDHGADLRAVQELMGHASILSTQIYTGVSRERIRKTFAQCHPRA